MSKIIGIVSREYYRQYNKYKDEHGEYQGCFSEEEYAEEMINCMSNHELLLTISYAVERFNSE